jgi:hypothetical protein
MTALTALKLISAKRSYNNSGTQQRRTKMSGKVFEQIELAKCLAAGTTYTKTKHRTFRTEDGFSKSVEVPVRVRAWWWAQDNGKFALSIRYGSRVIALSAKSNAIECASYVDLINALTTIKSAVDAGELDEHIERASVKLRDGFTK